MSSLINYLDLCRMCLSKDRVSVPIFESEGLVRQLLHKITTCGLPVKISREDNYPKKLCDDCVNKVEFMYQFWNTTSSAEEQLRQLVGGLSLEDKFDQGIGVLHSKTMGHAQNNNNDKFNDIVIQVLQQENNMNMQGILDMPIIPTNEEDFALVDTNISSNVPGLSTQTQTQELVTHQIQETEKSQDVSHNWCNNLQTLSVNEKGEKIQNNEVLEPTTFLSFPCDEPASSDQLWGHKISEISEMTMQQMTYSDTKNRPLEITILGPLELLNINSNPEPINSTSSYFHEMTNNSYLEDISNATCTQIPSPTLFLENLSDPSTSTFFDKFPDPELIADSELLPYINSDFTPQEIPNSMCIPPALSFQNPIPNLMTLDVRVNANLAKNPRATKKGPTAKSKTSDGKLMAPKTKTGRVKNQHFCELCIVGFENKKKLGLHMMNDHQIELPWTCCICARSFRTENTMYRHKRMHEPEAKQFGCDQCEYSSNQKSNLTMHIRRRHEKNYKYSCDCGSGFMQRTKFLEHLALHEGNFLKKCKLCPRLFTYQRNLHQHMVDAHPEAMPVPIEPRLRIPCPQCSKSFAKNQSLQRHLKTHHTEPKKFQCTECNAVLSCKSSLTQHMRGHKGIKVATCEECGKKFSKWQNYTVHLRVHTGERPYNCPECDKSFAQRTTMMHHRRTHLDVRPFKCDQCEKGFVSGSQLKKHAKKHLKKDSAIVDKMDLSGPTVAVANLSAPIVAETYLSAPTVAETNVSTPIVADTNMSALTIADTNFSALTIADTNFSAPTGVVTNIKS